MQKVWYRVGWRHRGRDIGTYQHRRRHAAACYVRASVRCWKLGRGAGRIQRFRYFNILDFRAFTPRQWQLRHFASAFTIFSAPRGLHRNKCQRGQRVPYLCLILGNYDRLATRPLSNSRAVTRVCPGPACWIEKNCRKGYGATHLEQAVQTKLGAQNCTS